MFSPKSALTNRYAGSPKTRHAASYRLAALLLALAVQGKAQEPFADIPRDDVRVGLINITESVTHSHPFAEILYVIDGSVSWHQRAEQFTALAGTVVLIPAETSHTLASASSDSSSLVFYRWAPGGDRATLHRQSTMTEPVALSPEAATGRIDARRYESQTSEAEGDSERSRTHIDDIEWTTNFTYSEELWKVYRYKPLVRDALVDWKGIAHDDVRMGLQELDPGAAYPTHHHPSPEIYVVLSGRAQWTLGEKSFVANPGTAVYTPPDTKHRIENTGTTPLRWLYFWWAPGGDVSVFAER